MLGYKDLSFKKRLEYYLTMKNFFLLIFFLLPVTLFADEPKFTHESELGLLLVSGNSDQNVFNFQTRNSSPMGNYFLKFGGHYTAGRANSVLNTENWDVNVRLERVLTQRFSIYFTEIIEANRFAGFSFRSKSELGAGYKIIQGEQTTLIGEASFQYMYEEDIPTKYLNNILARLYGVYNYKFSENASAKLWAELLPNLTVSQDYFFNTEASVTSNINTNFALKFAYLYKYRGLPPDSKLNWDQTTSMSIIAKI